MDEVGRGWSGLSCEMLLVTAAEAIILQVVGGDDDLRSVALA